MNGVALSKQAFATVQKSFAGEAAEAFGFLAGEFGLSGPEFQGVVLPVVAFAGRGVRYRIMLDSDDKSVMTRVEMEVDAKRLVAELENLVQAAGLGPSNAVAISAHTLNGLRQTLEAQARYVRLLQPQLAPETAVALMRTAKAREWHLG
jgi:hypothetical protein